MKEALLKRTAALFAKLIIVFLPVLLFSQIIFAQDDPDMPDFARYKLNKEEFMRQRAAAIARLRGIDSNTVFNPQQRIDAIQQMKAQEDLVRSSGRNNLIGDPWIPIGPAPIPNGQVASGGSTPVSGRVISIAIHPTNPNIVYVGTAQGGLYRTTNGGTSWTSIMDDAMSLAIGSIAISPSSPETVYVGTGEPNFSLDSYFGVGVYRIDNASTTATLSGPFNLDGSASNVFTGRSIGKIIVHPTNPDIIFVSSTSGVGGISGAANSVLPSRGVYRCNNATSGSPVFNKLTGLLGNLNVSVHDIAIDPLNPNILLVIPIASGGSGGIHRSVNALDPVPANVTFTQTFSVNSTSTSVLNGELAAIHPVANTDATFYAALGFDGGTVQRSTDGGQTWTQQIDNNFCTPQCFYDIAIAIDPTDENTVYLGGSPTIVAAKSINGGTTFTDSKVGVHVDTHAMMVAPSDATQVWLGTDGGIYKSVNSGTTWANQNTTQFSATQFMSLAVHPTDQNFTIGGTQDNGTNWYQPASTWTRIDGGDGGYTVIDQNAVDNVNVRQYHTYFNATNLQGYGTTATAGGVFSFRGCQTTGATVNGITCNGSINFYAPLERGPGNPNTIYYGSDRLYRSDDNGTTHTVVSQNPITSGVPISAIGISPQNDNVRIVGLNNGGLFGTSTGATTLVNLDPSNTVPNVAIARSIIDPNTATTAYVTLSAFGVNSVWKSVNFGDAGTTWSSASSGLPQVPVNAIVIDPDNSNNVYIGTDIGVYGSTDAGATWLPFGTGLPRVAVFGIAITGLPNKILRIATHGRGMWQNSLIAAAPTVTIDQAVAQPDPTSTSPINFTVVFSEPVTGFTTGDVTLSGTAGATTGTVTGSGATYNVAVSGMTSSGTVIATIAADVATGTINVIGNAASTSTDNTVTFNLVPVCPTITGTTPGSACGPGPVSVELSATSSVPATFNWYDMPSGGTLIGNGSPFNTPPIGTTTTYYVSATADGCESARSPVIASIIPPPAVFNVTGGGTDCAGGTILVGLDGSESGVNYQLVLNGSTNVGAPLAGTGAALDFGNQTTTGTYSVVATNTTTTCSIAMTGNAMVTINTAPAVVTNPVNTSVPNTGSTSLTAVFSGAPAPALQWEISTTGPGGPWTPLTNAVPYSGVTTGTLTINPASIAMDGNYYRCVGTNICPPSTATSAALLTVTLGPTSSVLSLAGPSPICSGVTTNLVVTITGGVSPYTVVYTDGSTNFTVNNYISGTNIPVSPTVTTTYSLVSVTDVNTNPGVGNSGTPTVTIHPVPNAVTTPTSQTICNASAITPIVLSGSVPGTTFTWTRDNTATVTGIPSSGSGSPINGTLTNTTNDPVIVTFTISPTANGCPGPTTTATVTVNPTATVDPVADQTICTETMTAPVNFTSPVSGVTYNWTNSDPSIGLAASGTGNIAAFMATNPSLVPVTATITVTPSISIPGGLCGLSAPQTFTNNTPVAIPTGPAVVSSTLVVSGVPTYLYNMSMLTNITHTFNGDLDMTITSPSGTVVTLSTDNGGGSDNVFNGTEWRDNANPGGQVPYTSNNGLVTDNSYVNLTTATPLVPEEAFAAFYGEDPNGTWTLTISDDAGGDGGSLASWSLLLSGLSAPPTLTNTTASNTTPTAIPTGPGVVTSTINVTGAGDVIHDVNITTFIRHTFAADLDVTIQSPSGTVVTLTTDNGGGNDDVFNGTVWDDSANPGGQVPYTNNSGLVTDHSYSNNTLASPLVPEESLAAFIGENPNGTWTLTISDDAGGDGGSLDSWSLDIQTAVCPIVCTGPSETFTITVNPLPTMTCPANITAASDLGSCTTVINYTPTVTGSPTPTLTYVLTGATTGSGSGSGSGTAFSVGVTTVNITATNDCATLNCSFTVTVTDSQLPVITSQPVDVTACSGTNATFSVTSTNVISYQWQVWNGSTWNNISGATSSVYTVNNVNTAMNTNTFRAVINGLCTTIISEPASLYVNSLPIVQLSASPRQALLPGQTTSLFASATPAGGSYAWFKNGSPINNMGSSLTDLDVDNLGVYSVTYTDLNGCISSSNNVEIIPTPSERVFVYPNPNTGAFQIRFYSSTSQPVTVTIFDSKGARVYQKRMISTSPYSRLDVNLSGAISGGTYVVEVLNEQGERIGARRILIGH